VIGVHHMQAHALTPRLCSAMSQLVTPAEVHASGWPGPEPAFPFLTLLVSGGHTLLLHSTGVANHRILASTNDIAIGDCLDKCARSILPQAVLDSSKDVSYGRLLESFAFPISGKDAYNETPLGRSRGSGSSQSPYGWQLPVPLLATRGGQKSKSMEFSFTGLATYAIRVATNGWVNGKLGTESRTSPMHEEEARFLAREVMRIAFEHLASRVTIYLQRERTAHNIMPTTPISTSLVISGGVAANQYLRHVFESRLSMEQLNIVIPPIDMCTDNAAMIAWTAHEMFPILFPQTVAEKLGRPGATGKHILQNIRSQDQLQMDVLRKWSLENIQHPEKESSVQDAIGDAATAGAVGKPADAKAQNCIVGSRRLESKRQDLSESKIGQALLTGSVDLTADNSMNISPAKEIMIKETANCGEPSENILHSSDDVMNLLRQVQENHNPSSRYQL
jgi:tRNA A37 threonylcarbamoyltransferase TsaD